MFKGLPFVPLRFLSMTIVSRLLPSIEKEVPGSVIWSLLFNNLKLLYFQVVPSISCFTSLNYPKFHFQINYILVFYLLHLYLKSSSFNYLQNTAEIPIQRDPKWFSTIISHFSPKDTVYTWVLWFPNPKPFT